MAYIVSIVTQKQKSNHDEEPFHYSRTRMEKVTLRAGHGIVGDKKAGKNPQRHLNLMSQETLGILNSLGYNTEPGEMGEQLVLADLVFGDLQAGMHLQLGEGAIIELSKPRTGCKWFQKVQGKTPPQGLQHPLGWMATVIESGEVAEGDSVQILQAEAG